MKILFDNGEEFQVTRAEMENGGMIFFERNDGIEYNIGLGPENKYRLIGNDV